MYTPPEYQPPEDPADEPEHVARYLAAPIEATWRAFDKGRAAADDFFAASDHRGFDPHIWAHIVRYEAVLSLRAEDEHPEWELLLRHHSGIEIEQGPFKFKVCKAAGDGPQNPGRNRARKEFFQQLGFSLFSGPHAAHFLLYWRIRKNDLELGLCKPKGLWRFKGVPKLEWQQPVAFDPLAGLRFPTFQDDDLPVLRLEESDAEGEVGG